MWKNQDLYVYHGTNVTSAVDIMTPQGDLPHSIRLDPHPVGRKRRLDFGPGFYVTTLLDQAIGWANRNYRIEMHKRRPSQPISPAAVIRFRVSRNAFAQQQDLVFTDPEGGEAFFAFTTHCRSGLNPAEGREAHYDMVAGPLLAWPNAVTIPRKDQIGFHTKEALKILLEPVIVVTGSPIFEAEP
jgi:hypothetical protein